MRERAARHYISRFWTSDTMSLATQEFSFPHDLKVVFICLESFDGDLLVQDESLCWRLWSPVRVPQMCWATTANRFHNDVPGLPEGNWKRPITNCDSRW
jgi:hypothetical protein